MPLKTLSPPPTAVGVGDYPQQQQQQQQQQQRRDIDSICRSVA